MYMLGYEDDGKATGMSPSDLSASIKTLRVMMEAVGAKIANMQARQRAWGGNVGWGGDVDPRKMEGCVVLRHSCHRYWGPWCRLGIWGGSPSAAASTAFPASFVLYLLLLCCCCSRVRFPGGLGISVCDVVVF